MKLKKYIVFMVIFVFMVAVFPRNALAAGSYFSGPSTVRSGDVITVKFALSGLNNVQGIQATINYSSSVLTLKSVSGSLSSPWKVESSSSGSSVHIIAYDDSGSTKLSGSKTICTLKFAVKGSSGTNFSVSASNIKVSVNGSDVSVGSSSYSKSIAAPLSSNANLVSLIVSNAKIYPSFSPSVTTYKTSVKYTVSSLNISAKASDSSAKVSVSNNSLKPGATTNVKVTVKAPAGNTKTYTIQATREQDPNYVASSDNFLSSITLNIGILSPVFSKDITEYVVWLPYEISDIAVSAAPRDSKASVKVLGGQNLTPGADNSVSVVCVAENGAEREYKITVKRASPFIKTQESVNMANVEGVLEQLKKLDEDSGEQNILLDLGTSASKQVSAKLFNELKLHPNASLTINTGSVKIVFKASDITEDIKEEYYDFSFLYNGEYADLIRQKAGDDNGIVFSFVYEGKLPGYATFYLLTNLNQGDSYNIYKFNFEEEKFYLIARDAVVLQAGVLPYVNNTCSEYIITKTDIKDAIEYESASKQDSVNTSGISIYKNDIIYLAMIAAALIIGFAIGAVIFSRKKTAHAEAVTETGGIDKSDLKNEKAEDENTEQSQVN